MKELICAPYDPLFYMHHSFVDLIFDLYLARTFPNYDVDSSIAYPEDGKIDVYYQRGSEPMRPFEGSGLKVQTASDMINTFDLVFFLNFYFLGQRRNEQKLYQGLLHLPTETPPLHQGLPLSVQASVV